jgi:Flp pilus assembly protein CpaB
VRLVVANRDIGAREPISLDELTYSVIPVTAAPAHAFSRVADLNGTAAVVPIYKGQVVSANLVTATPDQLLAGQESYLPIPAGYVALTIPMGEQMGVAGYISQGDYIDVIANVNTGLLSPVNPHMVVRTVFRSVYVIRVGPESAAPKQGQPQGVASSLTILMTRCDAEYMDWLIANASLKYTLIPYTEYTPRVPAADPSCASTTEPPIVGPAQVDVRWGMTKS